VTVLCCGIAAGQGSTGKGLVNVEFFCVDDNATTYATFQSHNQKVLSTPNGIFMTHLRSRNEEYTAQQWRLSRSTDGGQTFSTVYESTDATNPAVIESDELGNVYLARPDFVDGNAYLYRFLAADEYRNPQVTTLEGGAAGKFCMIRDETRGRLYHFAHNGTFHTTDLDGTVLGSQLLISAGEHAYLQYPSLCMEGDVLHAAWTTVKRDAYLYWDIHHMLSRDGGETWETMAGQKLTVPVVADDSGPADRISLDEDFEVHSWLSNVLVKNGKAHFIYMAQSVPPKQHYVRYDVATGKREIDVFPRFGGETIALQGLSGFLASNSSVPDAPLYCVMASGQSIGCLISRDNGTTWQDYAVSEPLASTYSIGGCREVTEDGYVIGSFTEPVPTEENANAANVHFFRIKAETTPPGER